MACPCCTPQWNCPCREPLDVRITIASPYAVNPNLGADPIANAIGTYILSRDRAADAAYNTGYAYYSLTPSGQSYSVDSPDITGWYSVPYLGVYSIVPVACYSGFTPSIGIVSYHLYGKFIQNTPSFGNYDVWTTRVSSSLNYMGVPTTACGTSSQATGRLTVLDTVLRYNSSGTAITGAGAYNYTSYDNATVTVQLNG